MQSEETVIVRREGRVGRLVLNRPQALNAIDLPMICAAHALSRTGGTSRMCTLS